LRPVAGDAPDADKDWNAQSLPFAAGQKGRIGMLRRDEPNALSAVPGKIDSSRICAEKADLCGFYSVSPANSGDRQITVSSLPQTPFSGNEDSLMLQDRQLGSNPRTA
jgi:hypothetical protein